MVKRLWVVSTYRPSAAAPAVIVPALGGLDLQLGEAAVLFGVPDGLDGRIVEAKEMEPLLGGVHLGFGLTGGVVGLELVEVQAELSLLRQRIVLGLGGLIVLIDSLELRLAGNLLGQQAFLSLVGQARLVEACGDPDQLGSPFARAARSIPSCSRRWDRACRRRGLCGNAPAPCRGHRSARPAGSALWQRSHRRSLRRDRPPWLRRTRWT